MARSDTDERHWIQRLMDNPWVLLALGVGVPFVSYTLWAWIEIMTLPAAKLP
jgi:hypothetical protein